MKVMARRWSGIRRPVEEAAIKRAERKRSAPPAEWWLAWNRLDGGEWAREKTTEEQKAQNLLRALLAGGNDDETEKARRLARALGLLDNGGDR
jgi:hypothetical protein